jgi:hypothetical protein
MRSIEHLHPVTKPPFGFKPITVPVGLEEKANGQYMLDRYSKDQEEGGLNRQFKIVLTAKYGYMRSTIMEVKRKADTL